MPFSTLLQGDAAAVEEAGEYTKQWRCVVTSLLLFFIVVVSDDDGRGYSMALHVVEMRRNPKGHIESTSPQARGNVKESAELLPHRICHQWLDLASSTASAQATTSLAQSSNWLSNREARMHKVPNLQGLALSRSERVIVLGLSYAWCTPLFFWFGERLWHYLRVLRRPEANNHQAHPPPPPPPART